MKEKRDRDTVILDEQLADTVVDDMRNFFTTKQALEAFFFKRNAGRFKESWVWA